MDDKTSIKSEMVECRKCSELESKCLELESEIEKKKTQFEKLEQKFRELEDGKNGIEEELKALKREKKGSDISPGVVDLTGEEEGDGVAQLMVENGASESEMKRDENEAESLKKLKELESRALNEAVEGTPFKHIICMEREKEGADLESKPERCRQVKKNLAFEEDRSLSKKIAPSTPSGVRTACFGVIDICDSDDEPDVPHLLSTFGDENIYISTDHPPERTVGSDKEITPSESSKRALFQYSYEENVDTSNDSVPVLVTPKRKRASNIVTSDTESDEDDVPICKLKRRNLQEIVPNLASSEMKNCSVTVASPGDDNVENLVTPPRRRLRKGAGKVAGGKRSSSKIHETIGQRGIPTTEDVEDAGSDSEGESLNGFIIDDGTEDSDGDDASSGAQDDSDVDFDEILSRLKRTKDQNLEWELEADMLSAFGKDPKLCMKAVCALYRQQTSDEKDCKGTLVYNSRGFSKFDAYRGTMLAEFLTDGDPAGELKKSVEELREYDPKGLELCRTFASRYSKQLFDICKNKEDPYFP